MNVEGVDADAVMVRRFPAWIVEEQLRVEAAALKYWQSLPRSEQLHLIDVVASHLFRLQDRVVNWLPATAVEDAGELVLVLRIPLDEVASEGSRHRRARALGPSALEQHEAVKDLIEIASEDL